MGAAEMTFGVWAAPSAPAPQPVSVLRQTNKRKYLPSEKKFISLFNISKQSRNNWLSRKGHTNSLVKHKPPKKSSEPQKKSDGRDFGNSLGIAVENRSFSTKKKKIIIIKILDLFFFRQNYFIHLSRGFIFYEWNMGRCPPW